MHPSARHAPTLSILLSLVISACDGAALPSAPADAGPSVEDAAAPPEEAPPIDTGERTSLDVAIERGALTRSDAARFAEAYASEMSGSGWEAEGPSEDEAYGLRATLPGDPGSDPSSYPPFVRVSTRTTTTIRLDYRCGDSASELERRVGRTGGFTRVRALTTCRIPSASTSDTGLTPGTEYCYRVRSTSASGTTSYTATSCGRTLYEPFAFSGPVITESASDAMLARFDWRHTEPLSTSGDTPPLWYANILVSSAADIQGLRQLGLHVQSEPIFRAELARLREQAVIGRVGDEIVGTWAWAIVPAALYNDIRARMISAIGAGQEPGLRAIVLREPAEIAARVWSTPLSPLSLHYVAEMGLEYNGYDPIQCSGSVCTISQPLLGWLVRKGLNILVDLVDAVVDGVRLAIGYVTRLVVGSIDLDLTFQTLNVDELFGGRDTFMVSGWSGRTMPLRGVTVRVYQGLAEFSAQTDASGRATVRIARGFSGSVCLELENDVAEITRFLTEEEICVHDFGPLYGRTARTIEVYDSYASLLAQLTDAHDWVYETTGRDVGKVSVFVGALASLFSGGTSFAPCMGRFPNLVLSLMIERLPPYVRLAAEIVEAIMAVDIVMVSSQVSSRGVGVHEYGHVVMCDLMREADVVDASTAWADVIFHIFSADAGDEQVVLGEGWADFFALQVVGGTGSTEPVSADWIFHTDPVIHYCHAGRDCFERDYTGSSTDLREAIARVVSLLQDAFDGATSAADGIHDGSYWRVEPSLGFVIPWLVEGDSEDGDEPIQLSPDRIRPIFRTWSDRSSTLTEESFLGALAVALRDAGYTRAEACDLFARHGLDGACPAYVSSLYPRADRVIVDLGSIGFAR